MLFVGHIANYLDLKSNNKIPTSSNASQFLCCLFTVKQNAWF